MEIFNVSISELDAKEWLKLCKYQKIEWILKYTNQTDLELIKEYVLNPRITKDCHCNDCGKKKKDEPKRDAEKIEAVVELEQVARNGGSRNKKK